MPTKKTNLRIVFLMEDELRAAASALTAFQNADSEGERFELATQALHACYTALHGANDTEALLMVVSARALLDASGK